MPALHWFIKPKARLHLSTVVCVRELSSTLRHIELPSVLLTVFLMIILQAPCPAMERQCPRPVMGIMALFSKWVRCFGSFKGPGGSFEYKSALFVVLFMYLFAYLLHFRLYLV